MQNELKEKRDDLYLTFEGTTIPELEIMLRSAQTHEERAFFRKLINFKLQVLQQGIIGEELV